MTLTDKQQKQLDIINGRLNAELQLMARKQKSIQILQQKINYISQEDPKDIMSEEPVSKAAIDKIFAMIISRANDRFPAEPTS